MKATICGLDDDRFAFSLETGQFQEIRIMTGGQVSNFFWNSPWHRDVKTFLDCADAGYVLVIEWQQPDAVRISRRSDNISAYVPEHMLRSDKKHWTVVSQIRARTSPPSVPFQP